MLSPFVLTLLPHLILGFVGTKPDDGGVVEIGQLIERGLGGVILFSRNIESPDQLKGLTAHLKSRRGDLLIATDQEGGAVQRLHPLKGFMRTDRAKAIGDGQKDPAAVESLYRALADQLKTFGINWNLAPCVDLHDDQSAAIGHWGRSYGRDPADVIRCAGAFIRAHQAVGVKTAIKHFPGHGLVQGDTHLGFVDITHTYHDDEGRPFQALKDMADSIMIAHVIHQDWDRDTPMTLSRPVIQDKVRAPGFDKILIADDLEMGAVRHFYPLAEAVCRSLLAGCDYVIVGRQTQLRNVTDGGAHDDVDDLGAFFAVLNEQEPGYPDLADSLLQNSRPRQQSFLGAFEEERSAAPS